MNLDGGIHEVPLPPGNGRLWLCGKHAIAPDPVAILDKVGADSVVCLVQRFEIEDRYPDYVGWLEKSPCATWFPIADLDVEPVEAEARLLDRVVDDLRSGRSIVAHCAAGIGRAGTLAVAICVKLGMSLEDSLDHVRRHRPGAGPEVGAQLAVVQQIARSLGRGDR